MQESKLNFIVTRLPYTMRANDVYIYIYVIYMNVLKYFHY